MPATFRFFDIFLFVSDFLKIDHNPKKRTGKLLPLTMCGKCKNNNFNLKNVCEVAENITKSDNSPS